jgi:UDP-N-acetylglucosamine 2-epimerase (non-hydrolysing)
MNRRLTGVMADLHFAPTEQARRNLRADGIPDELIHVTGNTVIDAVTQVRRWIESRPALRRKLEAQFHFLNASARLILVTGHRRENFGEGFENICRALAQLVKRHADLEIVYPVHLNPNVQEPVRRLLEGLERIHLIDPVDYVPFVYLLGRCHFVITDSGGVQEEAPSLGKPVLVMRETTERPEAVEAGTVRLVGTKVERIVTESEHLLTDAAAYEAMARAHNPYGDGQAAERIAGVLGQERLGQRAPLESAGSPRVLTS